MTTDRNKLLKPLSNLILRVDGLIERFIGRMVCPHHNRRIISIEWDGTTKTECITCGKRKDYPL